MKKQALVNVTCPENILPLANFLIENGWEIFAEKKSATFLSKNSINANVEKSFYSEKNLQLFFSLVESVASTGNHSEIEDMNKIREVHLVCIDLPIDLCVLKDLRESAALVESIDERSIAILQAAAKNYKNVIVLTDYKDYHETIIRLRTDNFTEDYRIYLAAKAMSMAAAYNSSIANSISRQAKTGQYPNVLPLSYQKISQLVSGINTQQTAAFYSLSKTIGASGGFRKIQGKKLSFDIVANISAAWKSVFRFSKFLKNPYAVGSTTFDGYSYTIQFTPAAGTVFTVAITYGEILGASLGQSASESCRKTFLHENIQNNKVTLACSSVIDEESAVLIAQKNVAAVIAPSFTQEAKNVFEQYPNIYVYNSSHDMLYDFEFMSVDGGLIVQSEDNTLFKSWQIVTRSRPTQEQADAMAFGTLVLMAAKYEAVAIIDNMSISNVWCSGRTLPIFSERDTDDEKKCVLVCNSHLHFDEYIKQIVEQKVSAIIQTGGTENDEAFIDFCNEHNIAMVFTGITHISI